MNIQRTTFTRTGTRESRVAAARAPALTLESAAYAGLGVLALALRLYNIGVAPLTAAESHEALSALRVATGGAYLASHSQLLNSLLAVTFWVLGASDALARLWPALAGSALVMSPLLFRGELGRPAALAAAAFLTISPALIAASRTADGSTLALVCLVALLGSWRSFARKRDSAALVLAGVALGAGLAAGSHFIGAAFVFGIAHAIDSWLAGESAIWEKGWNRLRPHLARVLAPAGIACVAIASLALLNRTGLSSAGAAIPDWFSGWAPHVGSRPLFLIPSLMVLYEPLALVLGLAGMYLVRSGDDFARTLVVYAFVGLVYGVVYNGRTSADVLYVSLPLTMLAAVTVVRALRGGWLPGELEAAAGEAALVLLLIVFAALNMATFTAGYQSGRADVSAIPLYLAAAVFVLILIVVILFAVGWSERASARATAAALLLALLVVSVHAGWGVSQVRAGDARELWVPDVVSPNVRLMASTLEQISLRHVGEAHEAEITVLGDPDGPLAWHLREFTHVEWADVLSPLVDSPVVITSADVVNPTLGSSYLGQEFGVYSKWNERLPAPAAAVGYVMFRYAPVEYERMVVWVREDVQLLHQG